MKHLLTIKPAIMPDDRHEIECLLEKMGFDVHGGGTADDMGECDISFGDGWHPKMKKE